MGRGRKKGSVQKRVGLSAKDALAKKQRERYLDPGFLPDCPCGDLAHLSDRKNTGAARKGLYEVYRCPLSTI